MNSEIKKLCENGQLLEAINLAADLPESKIDNLAAIGKRIVAGKLKGSERDGLLKELIFKLVKAGGFRNALAFIPEFENRQSAEQMEIGICQVAERRHEMAAAS